MKKTHLAVTASVAIVAALAVAMCIKCQSGQIKDSYFYPDHRLRQMPGGLVALRPTHFPDSSAEIRHYHENDSLARTVGRNVSLLQTIAEAYDCDPAQVLLPPDAPTNRFDFLVTTSGHVRERLRMAIQQEFHYTARRETQNRDVFILRVINPVLPGLAVSRAGEARDINYNDGKLYFTRQPMSTIAEGLSKGLNRPVLNETSVTNAFDFSVTWNGDVEKAMENGQWDLAGARKVLARWGLALESTNVPMEMYVVTHTP